MIFENLPAQYKVPQDSMVCYHGLRTIKKAALTFDACSSRGKNRFDQKIVDILVETLTPATLFLGGVWMEKNSEAVTRLGQQPLFELALHGYHHPHLTKISKDSVIKELQSNQTTLEKLAGIKAQLFRPPYGEFNAETVVCASQLGLRLIEYDLPSGDPDTSATAQLLTDYVSTMTRNGSIIVMHMNGRGWHTAEALSEIIRRLRKRDFKLVTVGELLLDWQKK